MTSEEREELTARNNATWGELDSALMSRLAPSMVGDPALAPGSRAPSAWPPARREARTIAQGDGRSRRSRAAARVRVPTLVMHRPREQVWDVRHSQYLAAHIPGARYVELEGVDSFPFLGDSDAVVEEIEEFLTGARSGGERSAGAVDGHVHRHRRRDRARGAASATGAGATCWPATTRMCARSSPASTATRSRPSATASSRRSTARPRARCAARSAITRAARELGVEVRVGIHTGECELIGDDVGGMAVHIASRVGGLAAPGEVLVSGTVFGTVVGGPFTFEDRGFHELKGVPGRWPLFALGVSG